LLILLYYNCTEINYLNLIYWIRFDTTLLKRKFFYSFLLSILLFLSLNILVYDHIVEGKKDNQHEDDKNNDDDDGDDNDNVRENEKNDDDNFDDTSLDKLFGTKQDKDTKENNDYVHRKNNEKVEDENGDSDNHKNDDIPFILPFNPVPFP
jgi:hypothetical protein